MNTPIIPGPPNNRDAEIVTTTREAGSPEHPLNNVRDAKFSESVLITDSSKPIMGNVVNKLLSIKPYEEEPISEDGILKDLPLATKNGKFRLSNKRIHLTYHYHFDPVKYLDCINEYIKPNKVNVYCIAQEFGKNKGSDSAHPHTHVALEFSKNVSVRNSRFFDYLDRPRTDVNPHPFIKKVSYMKHWKHICSNYLSKETVPYTNFIGESGVVSYEELRECKKSSDVLKVMNANGVKMEKAGPLIKAWEHIEKPSPPVEKPFKEWYPWQQYFTNILDGSFNAPGDRVVIWIYNEGGAMGKTKFSEYLVGKYGAFVLTTQNSRNGLHALKKRYDQTGNMPAVIIDISRADYADRVYGLIEKLKSSQSTSEKYDSSVIDFDRVPLVFVFSNSPPDTSRLSADRWLVYVSQFDGKDFGYTFEGNSGKKFHDMYIDEELKMQKQAEEDGKSYMPCVPFGQRNKIDIFDDSLEFMSLDKRRTYWERGMNPVLMVESTVRGTRVTLTEKPMEPELFKRYKSWKDGCDGTAISAIPTPEEIAANAIRERESMIRKFRRIGYTDDELRKRYPDITPEELAYKPSPYDK